MNAEESQLGMILFYMKISQSKIVYANVCIFAIKEKLQQLFLKWILKPFLVNGWKEELKKKTKRAT